MKYTQAIATQSNLLETIELFHKEEWELVSHTWVDGFFHLIFKDKL